MPSTAMDAISITPYPARLRVIWNGTVIADTTEALRLHEPPGPAVLYFPRADVDMTMLAKSPLKIQCPQKGEATYFSIESGDRSASDSVWSYETPFPAAEAIAGFLAFKGDCVEFVENNTP